VERGDGTDQREHAMWTEILTFALVGFFAQLVDGAIGMAFGIITSSLLLSLGLPPVVVSQYVHVAEIFTTGASGLSHWRLGNIDRTLFLRLALPGAIGGGLGALVLTQVPGETLKPFISGYLVLLGLFILYRAFCSDTPRTFPRRHVAPLGLGGGFLDAVGGGGWGPIVTTTLLSGGEEPRTAIGTVSASEFFVTSAIAFFLIAAIGITQWPMLAGLIVGGVLAAPFAAYATRLIPRRAIMVLVGTAVTLISSKTLGIW
jgi:uncharacterized membrane protein YfcA